MGKKYFSYFVTPLNVATIEFVSVVSQSYTVNLWEENVLRGNAAILKCHIPSFVTEYVTISSWIISEGEVEEMEINLDSDFNLGNTPLSTILPHFQSYPQIRLLGCLVIGFNENSKRF